MERETNCIFVTLKYSIVEIKLILKIVSSGLKVVKRSNRKGKPRGKLILLIV